MNTRLMVRGAITTVIMVVGLVCVAAVPYAGSALVISASVQSPAAIVSLASHEWERLPAAASLARRYPKALVVLTLPQLVNGFNCHDCAHRAEWLTNAGIDPSRIRIVPLTEGGTYGEAVATRSLVIEHRLKSVLVVTSPYHTRRSLATFRQVVGAAGASVGVEPATRTSPARPERWLAASYDRAYVRYEWAAVFYYWLRYGVPPFAPAAI